MSDKTTRLILIYLIVWNVFDVVLHMVVNQIDPLRVTANLIALSTGLILYWGRIKQGKLLAVLTSLILFSALNGVFISENNTSPANITLIFFSIIAYIALLVRLKITKH